MHEGWQMMALILIGSGWSVAIGSVISVCRAAAAGDRLARVS
jgi:hypothetical protein